MSVVPVLSWGSSPSSPARPPRAPASSPPLEFSSQSLSIAYHRYADVSPLLSAPCTFALQMPDDIICELHPRPINCVIWARNLLFQLFQLLGSLFILFFSEKPSSFLSFPLVYVGGNTSRRFQTDLGNCVGDGAMGGGHASCENRRRTYCQMSPILKINCSYIASWTWFLAWSLPLLRRAARVTAERRCNNAIIT